MAKKKLEWSDILFVFAIFAIPAFIAGAYGGFKATWITLAIVAGLVVIFMIGASFATHVHESNRSSTYGEYGEGPGMGE